MIIKGNDMASKKTRPITICGYDVDFCKGNLKNLHIRVRKDGSVYVSAPRGTSMSEVEEFIESNREWLDSAIAKRKAAYACYSDRDTIMLFGDEFKLMIIDSPSNDVIKDDRCIYVRTQRDPELLIRRYLNTQLMPVAKEYLDKWTSYTGLQCDDLRTKYMHTKWATCNHRVNRIWLSTKLAHKPLECIDYVILHEVCHLRHPNHGPAFHSMLADYMPDWKIRQDRLNGKISS